MQIDTGSSENGYRSIHNILSLQLLDELDSPISQNVHDSNPKHYQQFSDIPSDIQPSTNNYYNTQQQQQEQQQSQKQIQCFNPTNLSQPIVQPQPQDYIVQQTHQQPIEIKIQQNDHDDNKQPNIDPTSTNQNYLMMEQIYQQQQQSQINTEEAIIDSQEQQQFQEDIQYIQIKEIVNSVIDDILKQVQSDVAMFQNISDFNAKYNVGYSVRKSKQMKIVNKIVDLSISKQKDVKNGKKRDGSKSVKNFNVLSTKKSINIANKNQVSRSINNKKKGSGFFLCTEIPCEQILPTQINFSIGQEDSGIKSARSIKSSRSGVGKGITLMSNSNKKHHILTENHQRSNIITKIQHIPKKNINKNNSVKVMTLKGKNQQSKKITVHKTIDLNRNIATEPAESERKVKKVNVNASSITCNPANFFSGRRVSGQNSSFVNRFL